MTAYSTNNIKTNGYQCAKKENFDLYFTLDIKNNSKRIIDLNVIRKMITLLEGNIRKKFS